MLGFILEIWLHFCFMKNDCCIPSIHMVYPSYLVLHRQRLFNGLPGKQEGCFIITVLIVTFLSFSVFGLAESQKEDSHEKNSIWLEKDAIKKKKKKLSLCLFQLGAIAQTNHGSQNSACVFNVFSWFLQWMREILINMVYSKIHYVSSMSVPFWGNYSK